MQEVRTEGENIDAERLDQSAIEHRTTARLSCAKRRGRSVSLESYKSEEASVCARGSRIERMCMPAVTVRRPELLPGVLLRMSDEQGEH